jgi:serine/threonine-protein kinase
MTASDLADLSGRLARFGFGTIDLESARVRHLAAGGVDEEDALLAFLREQGQIDDVAFAAVAPYATVVVTERPPGARAQEDIPTVMMAVDDEKTVVDPRLRAATATPGSRPAPAAPAVGGALRYVIVGTAGKGGMGTVRVARDVSLLRKVALKELALEAAANDASRARFVREVQVTAQLDHPNIVPVYGLEVAPGGAPAYAMKLVEGRTFAQLIAGARAFHERGASPDEAHALPARLEHFLKVCDAIAYAHDKGVIHRDLKPANLMLGPHHEVYVMDWGLCRVSARPETDEARAEPVSAPGAGATQQGAIMGTPAYMSPEQALGRQRELGPASDQCALGLILYELVTLRPPYSGETLVEILAKAADARRGPWRAPGEGEAVPAELQAIVERATRKDPAARYASVAALADDLRRFLRGEAVDARPDTAWERLVRALARRRQSVALVVLGCAVAALAAFAGLLWRHERALEERAFREGRLHDLVNDVGRQGDRLQRQLLEVEAEIEALAAVTAHGLLREEALPPAKDAGRLPSLEGASLTALPGADPVRVSRIGQGFARAEPVRRALVDRARDAMRPDSPEAPSPVTELRLVLAAGLEYRYPAGASASDPRREPWYESAIAGEARWGEPVHDAAGRVLVPLTAPIRTLTGETHGALGLVVSIDGLLDDLLRARPATGATRTLLLDGRNRVLSARPAGEQALAAFADPALAPALAADEVGFVPSRAIGAPALLAFDRVHPFEWTLVAVAPEAQLFARD